MMKYFAVLAFFIIIFYLLGFIKSPKKFQWMDKNYTMAVKGLAILMVAWAHSGAMLSIDGIQFIGGIGVALFLMCSGYGLEISYQKNGLKGFWKKRLLAVCIPFWVIELIGLLVTGMFSVKTYLFDFIFIKPATSYGWFMGYIIFCYLIFYIVNKIVLDSERKFFVLLGIFIIWFCIESLFFANPNMPFLRARQMISFPSGILLAMKKEKIESKLTKSKSLLVFMGGVRHVFSL